MPTQPGTLASYVALGRATANTAVLDGRLLPIRAAKLVGILNDALEKVARVSDPLVARTRAELEAALAGVRSRGGRVALVPTMGALHDGHASLLTTRARQLAARTTPSSRRSSSTPLQFGPGEDLERYPRTFDADLALCADAASTSCSRPPSTRSTRAASRW